MKTNLLKLKSVLNVMLLILLMNVVGITQGFAQSNNNEDEVVKIDWYNQHATKEGELIVKFADGTPMLLQNNNRGALQTTGMLRVDALLQQYPVARAERLCPNDDPQRELRVSKSYNGPDVVERDLSRLCRFVMEDPMQTYSMIEALNELEEVEFAEPNYMAFALGMEAEVMSPISPVSPIIEGGDPKPGSYHNTWAYTHQPLYSLQWGIGAVHLPELWAADENNNNDRAIIAILDTGVDIEHLDLAANIWTNPGETNNGYDDDNNGFADDIHGWDFVNHTGEMHDWNSHGTHCAGIAAAVGDNNVGMTGANPKAYIMPIAVLQSNGTGDVATIIQGINYAKNNGANVLSMSFGSYSNSIALEQALGQAYQNAVLVAAAGNDGKHIDPRCCPDPTHAMMDKPMFPAAYSFVFGVEATQSNGYVTQWSNTDCDGPSYSQYGEEQLYNYELQAPGATIYSTVPNGYYKALSGTSMACPLVAGGISALLHAKPYTSQEMLWGDLINTAGNHVNFKACYDMGDAPAQLDFVCMELNDTIGGDGDYRPDAGETIYMYPTLRSTWGATDNIMMWLTVEDYEDPNIVTFLDNNPVTFGWPLSAYAKSKSANPLRFTIDSDCADGRTIGLVLHLTANPSQYQLNVHFTIQVENGVELSGMITDTVTLYPNVHYIVTSNLALTENALLIIKPGTILKFKDNVKLSNIGRIYAVGTPDSLITFSKTDLGNSWGGMTLNYCDTLGYCKIEYITAAYAISSAEKYTGVTLYTQAQNGGLYSHPVYYKACIHNSILTNNLGIYSNNGTVFSLISNSNFSYNQLNYTVFRTMASLSYDLYVNLEDPGYYYQKNNFILNQGETNYVDGSANYGLLSPNKLLNSNWFNNSCYSDYSDYHIGNKSLCYLSDKPVEESLSLIYLGSGREDIVRQQIYDFETPGSTTFGRINLDNMASRPTAGAHGIVWKVVVNGYDAQDEFEQLPPLGCGTHEFKVYFNRPMDKSVTPFISMGVRPPYTQHAISENGSWNDEGTIYTAYLTINGSTATDGLNRIYVANAKDDEHFEIPIENMRFNVQVASAGSLSNEFMATPGLGKVDLEWNNNEGDFEDYLGYNMYRYRYDSVLIAGHYDNNWNWIAAHKEWMATDSIQLNTSLVQDTLFTDYDVIPGQRYYYYYKVMRTNLTESDASLTVTTVPLTATKGDANGSMAVDVADVVTIVSYLTNGNPQPFIFEAADANSDGNIDILDIVAVINLIINRGDLPEKDPIATAYYTIEDGVLFVDTPVELGGVQVLLGGIGELGELQPLQAMNGFEQVKVNTSNGALFLAYSMSGKKLEAGKHALLRIGEASISDVALSDPTGHNVMAVFKESETPGDETIFLSMPYPNPFNNTLIIPFIIGDDSANSVSFTITNIMGQEVARIELGSRGRGEYTYDWTPSASVTSGIYTIVMCVDGHKVQQSKVVYVK